MHKLIIILCCGHMSINQSFYKNQGVLSFLILLKDKYNFKNNDDAITVNHRLSFVILIMSAIQISRVERHI